MLKKITCHLGEKACLNNNLNDQIDGSLNLIDVCPL